ncbi:MAG: hypothetical protein J3K34DRAFT_433937 [Monoraphidium minutum]|nr:MAG: hypothetical protein J3K34DRAFT_433937 [Monoraphidium minutum]
MRLRRLRRRPWVLSAWVRALTHAGAPLHRRFGSGCRLAAAAGCGDGRRRLQRLARGCLALAPAAVQPAHNGIPCFLRGLPRAGAPLSHSESALATHLQL